MQTASAGRWPPLASLGALERPHLHLLNRGLTYAQQPDPTTFPGRLGAAGAAVGLTESTARARADEPLAILGGNPVRKGPFSTWPVIGESEERTWMEVLKKGQWCRLGGDYANRFEEAWANTLGAQALPGRCQWHKRADHFAGRTSGRTRR